MQLLSRRSLSTVAFVASLATLLVLGSVMLNASSFARNGNPATPGQGSRITLMVAPMLPNRTLKSATGYAEVDVDEGKVEITVNLPEGAELPAGTPLGGDSLISQDVRLTKRLRFNERLSLDLIGEVFNLFNVANYRDEANVTQVLDAVGTGRAFLAPVSRATSVFGTGGPRAFQFAAKFRF